MVRQRWTERRIVVCALVGAFGGFVRELFTPPCVYHRQICEETGK
jgi:hypothetical protein